MAILSVERLPGLWCRDLNRIVVESILSGIDDRVGQVLGKSKVHNGKCSEYSVFHDVYLVKVWRHYIAHWIK